MQSPPDPPPLARPGAPSNAPARVEQAESARPANRQVWGILLGLIVLGVALRAYPILWGSQYFHAVQYNLHPDEPKIVRYIDDFPESLQTNHDYRYPTFLHNAYGAAWWAVASPLGWTSPEESFAGQPSYERALIFSRALHVLLFGLGALWLLWLAGVRFGSQSVALWTVAAASVQGWVVSSTALVQTDVPAAFGLLAVFYTLGKRDRQTQLRPRDGWVPGLWLGAATAMKYTSAIGGLALAITAFAAWKRRAVTGRGALGFLVCGGAGALALFLLFVPGALYDAKHFWISIQYEFLGKAANSRFEWATFVRGWLGCMPLWIGIPALAGSVLWWQRDRSVTLVSMLVCLGLYVLITARSFREDYAIPLMPFAALFSGVAFARLQSLRPRLGLPQVYIAAGLAMVAWTVHQRYAGDTRYRFDAWVHAHVPPGPLGDGPNPLRRSWASPALPAGYQFVSVHKLPEWVVLCERHWEPVLNVLADPRHYEQQGVIFDPADRKLLSLTERDFRFYEDVLLGQDQQYHYELVQEFNPPNLQLDMQGLAVKVYRRRPPSE